MKLKDATLSEIARELLRRAQGESVEASREDAPVRPFVRAERGIRRKPRVRGPEDES